MPKLTKPPVGLSPSKFFLEARSAATQELYTEYKAAVELRLQEHNQARRIAIVEAIGRYTLAKVAIPKDWSEELMALNAELA